MFPITCPASAILTNIPFPPTETGEPTTCGLCKICFNSSGVTENIERLFANGLSKCCSTIWRNPAETGCPVSLRWVNLVLHCLNKNE